MQRNPPPSSGILSNVFSFVAHEFQSFVSAAAGAEPPLRKPRASSSRIRLDAKPYKQSKGVAKHFPKGKTRESRGGSGETRRRVEYVEVRRTEDAQDDADLMPPPPVSRCLDEDGAPPKYPPSIFATSGEPWNERGTERQAPEYGKSTPSVVKKAVPYTMPGSLFPRSPSMEPEFAALSEQERRVRCEGGVPSSLRKSFIADDMDHGSLVQTPSHQRDPPRVPPDTPSAVRISGGPSVKGAAGRFADDADHALMLPNPSTSPGSLSIRQKGKDIASDYGSEASVSPRKDKGKGRALDWEYDFGDAETSGEIRVRGMERELFEAREEQRRKELEEEFDLNQSILIEERERDRERIRMLEEEVERLKRQLEERKGAPSNPIPLPADTFSTSRFDAPPPPPPPPPPPGSSFSIPMTVAGIRNLNGSGTASATDSFLISARASLKPTGQPIEAPINALPRTRRARQPTVNVPSDKMAAFLDEMKNAKLKKTATPAPVRTMTARSNSGPRRCLDVGNVTISGESSRDILLELARNRSNSLKRKRGEETSIDVDDLPTKRRFKEAPSSISESSQSSVASTVSVPSSSNSQSTQSTTFSFFDRTWPSTSTAETEMTTPSLCSDNEDEPSSGNPLPPTPPRRRQDAEEPPFAHAAEFDDDHAQQAITTRDSSSPAPRSPSPLPIEQPQPAIASPKPREINLLAIRKRVPSSPMPSSTPKKPVPPARARVTSKTQLPQITDDDDENPFNVPFSPPSLRNIPLPKAAAPPPSRIPRKADKTTVPKSASSQSSHEPSTTRDQPAPPPQSQSQQATASSTSNQVKRRRTLDEELRRAGDQLWVEGDADEEDAQDLDSGVLVGVGSKSLRKGFLSGGGAAGIPVFMGPGYVEGAEEEDRPPRQRSRGVSRCRR
ncbi:hypothetical protein BXZ70DRAFT_1079000 [Cristinia sonorae]|uniref:Uncharacterized protein n=1 Tax=Cristinia sonorae TaxID=1940300 RepID=A0A8K0UJS2_9AGAR|nr:hypothetical protein BXZ70DRAFT_1079000 [Cristinia sonorae]